MLEQAALKAVLGQGPPPPACSAAARSAAAWAAFSARFVRRLPVMRRAASRPRNADGRAAFAFRNAPRFRRRRRHSHAIPHAGEIVLNAAQQKNVADLMKGGAPQVVVHNHAAGVTGRFFVTRGEMQMHVSWPDQRLRAARICPAISTARRSVADDARRLFRFSRSAQMTPQSATLRKVAAILSSRRLPPRRRRLVQSGAPAGRDLSQHPRRHCWRSACGAARCSRLTRRCGWSMSR